MKIFPNPASSHQVLTIFLDELVQGQVNISLYLIDGQCITTKIIDLKTPEQRILFALQNLPRGIYTVVLEYQKQCGVQRLLIQ